MTTASKKLSRGAFGESHHGASLALVFLRGQRTTEGVKIHTSMKTAQIATAALAFGLTPVQWATLEISPMNEGSIVAVELTSMEGVLASRFLSRLVDSGRAQYVGRA